MYLSPQKASEKYDIHPKTLSRLADAGVIEFIRMPNSKHRRYKVESIDSYLGQVKEKVTICYARVSTHSQKEDLRNQLVYLQERYPVAECISEVGSGLNFKRRKFLQIMTRVSNREIGQIVVAYPDRLVRFGFDFVEWFCELFECRILVLNNPTLSPHQEMMQDFMSIMHCFSAKLYFLRKYEKKILEDLEPPSSDIGV